MSVARKVLVLSLSFAAGWILAGATNGNPAKPDCARKPEEPNGPQPDVAELPILFHTMPTPQDIYEGLEATRLNRDACAAYLRLVRYALSAYPSDILARSRIERIVVVGRLTRDNRRIAGFAHFGGQTIYLAAEAVEGRYRACDDRTQSKRRIIHHELFHFIDRYLMPRYDQRWIECNQSGFEYGEKRKHLGCISEYAATSLTEDRCEIFAAVMAKDWDIRERLLRDLYLSKKVSLLEECLRKISPELADHFCRIYAQK